MLNRLAMSCKAKTESGLYVHLVPACSLLTPLQFVISHVPIAPDPPPLTAQLVCTPRLCIKATAYPAVQKATTLTMASAKV